MKIALFKRKYRVLEKVMGNGKSKFYPQEKLLFKWTTLSDHHFDDLDRANKFIIKVTESARAKTEVKIKAHHFDEVFEKLKTLDNHQQ